MNMDLLLEEEMKIDSGVGNGGGAVGGAPLLASLDAEGMPTTEGWYLL